MMKKLLAAAVMLTAVAFGVPAHADNLAPCVAVDGALALSAGLGTAVAGDPFTCSYVTASNSQGILVLTPLDVLVTGTHKNAAGATITDYSHHFGGTEPDPAANGSGQISIPAGDTVTLTMSADCVPSDPSGMACGWIGAVLIGDSPL